MAEVSITLGPPSRSNALFWRVPGNADLLVVDRRLHGCAFAVALLLLILGARLERSVLTHDPAWGLIILGLILGSIGALLLFTRSRLVFDRRRQTLSSHLVLLGSFERSTRSIESATAVRVDEHFQQASDGDSATTTFTVKLELAGAEQVELATAGVWERIVPIAEAVSAFLGLPLYDYVVDTLREPDELDLPVLERETPRRRHAPKPPGNMRCVIEISGSLVRLTFPPPDGKVIVLIAAFVSLFWTLPVFLSGSLVVALLPLALLAWSWFYVKFGLRASVEIEGSTLRVVRHGILIDRIYEFPGHELEDLAVRSPEWGGSRNVVAHLTDGYLVARSDAYHARFGWGMSKRELEWLRAYILAVLEPPQVATSKRVPEDDIPVGPSPRIGLLIGLGAGALAARVLGGRLELCLAVPFLEHVINVGGLIGLVAASYLAGRRDKTLRPVAWGAVALLAAAVFYRAHPMLQPFPTYDELMVAELQRPPASFWVGWTVVATLPNMIGAALLLRFAGLLRRMPGERKTRPRPVPRPPNPEREQRIVRVVMFVCGLPLAVTALLTLFNALTRPEHDRAMKLIMGVATLILGLALMQVWRLIPKHLWPTGIDWGTMIGALSAGGAGTFIIAISIFGDDSGMNAPRPVIAAAGATFLFAGVAILPQAIPRMARAAEWISRIAASLLLTCFAAVALWVVLAGSLVFIFGLLVTGGMALASWASLFREAWRARGKRV